MKEKDQALAKIDLAKQALAEAKTIQEVKKIADMAEAARIYAQRSKAGKEVEQYAMQISVLAERRLGEMLAAAKKQGEFKHGGDRQSPKSKVTGGDIALEDVGIPRNLSSRAQAIASVPPAKFESLYNSPKLSRSSVQREAKREERKTERSKIVEQPAELISGPFEIILADPPWQYQSSTTTPERQIEEQYPTASVEEIIKHRPDSARDSVLFLWATAPLLCEALHVLSEWGFTYKTNAVWDKEKIGLGYWFRIAHEHLLVGIKGKASPPAEEFRISSIFREERTKHSKKPESVYQWIEAAFPSKKKLEMYARSKRVGWASFGNEIVCQ